jgi:hypothetical protein
MWWNTGLMNSFKIAIAVALGTTIVSPAASAQQVELNSRNLLDVVPDLKPGQYLWAPEQTGDGPALVIVNLQTQKLVMFRNGVPIGASTVSTGKTGHETPTGVFSILQKRKEHYSKKYNNAPMPNMQRLTWSGIALHAGNLPGFPASHGCIRLPLKFSQLLFGATNLGMTVVIANLPTVPRDSDEPAFVNNVASASRGSFSNASYDWNPQGTSDDPPSIVISTADQRAIVMRDGKQIGSAPVHVDGEIDGGVAYVLESWDSKGKHWLKLQFSGRGGSMEVAPKEADRFDAPATFRTAVAAAVRPGTVVIVTPESLKAGSPGMSATVLETDGSSR